MIYTKPNDTHLSLKSPFINTNISASISSDIDKHINLVERIIQQDTPLKYQTYAITIYESIMADSIGVTEEELKAKSINYAPFRLFLVDFNKNQELPFIAQSYLFSSSREDRIEEFCSIVINSRIITSGDGSNLLKLFNFVIEYCISKFTDMDFDTDYRDPFGFKSFVFDKEVTLTDIMFILNYITIQFKHLMGLIDHGKISSFKILKDMNISPTFDILEEDIMEMIWKYSKLDYTNVAQESDFVKLCKDVYNKLQMR